jgi:hypothetical protein
MNNITNTLIKVGSELYNISKDIENSKYYHLINKAIVANKWFTVASIQESLKAISESLQKHKIEQWINNYNINNNNPKTIGVVMAGNIRLVGFHDILCVLASGNNILAKLSSKDKYLYQIINLFSLVLLIFLYYVVFLRFPH